MPHEFINEQVDIYQLPSIDVPHKGSAGTQVTIGDLHGNAIKLKFGESRRESKIIFVK